LLRCARNDEFIAALAATATAVWPCIHRR
jgi:hypothetical protein